MKKGSLQIQINKVIMQIFKCFIITVVMIIVIASCKNQVKKVYYPNGQLKFIGNIVNGSPNGECIMFYENGKILQISNWKAGKLHGLRKIYNVNGNLKEKSFWKNGLLHGLTILYLPSGKIEMIGKYEDNKRIGWFKFFDSNGKLNKMSEYTIIEGKSLINQKIIYNEQSNILKEQSTYISFEPKYDTLLQNKAYTIKIKLEAPYSKQNMRVIFKDCIQSTTIKEDTIEGKNFIAFYKFIPKKKGIYQLCGRVQNYGNPIINGNTIRVDSRDIFFTRKFIVR